MNTTILPWMDEIRIEFNYFSNCNSLVGYMLL